MVEVSPPIQTPDADEAVFSRTEHLGTVRVTTWHKSERVGIFGVGGHLTMSGG